MMVGGVLPPWWERRLRQRAREEAKVAKVDLVELLRACPPWSGPAMVAVLAPAPDPLSVTTYTAPTPQVVRGPVAFDPAAADGARAFGRAAAGLLENAPPAPDAPGGVG